MSTMWAPLSIKAVVGINPVGVVRWHFQNRCSHCSGGGLTDSRVSSSSGSSEKSCMSGKIAATVSRIAGVVLSSSGSTSVMEATVVERGGKRFALARTTSCDVKVL